MIIVIKVFKDIKKDLKKYKLVNYYLFQLILL